MTGVDAPYEAPERPELEIGGHIPAAEAVDRALALIARE